VAAGVGSAAGIGGPAATGVGSAAETGGPAATGVGSAAETGGPAATGVGSAAETGRPAATAVGSAAEIGGSVATAVGSAAETGGPVATGVSSAAEIGGSVAERDASLAGAGEQVRTPPHVRAEDDPNASSFGGAAARIRALGRTRAALGRAARPTDGTLADTAAGGTAIAGAGEGVASSADRAPAQPLQVGGGEYATEAQGAGAPARSMLARAGAGIAAALRRSTLAGPGRIDPSTTPTVPGTLAASRKLAEAEPRADDDAASSDGATSVYQPVSDSTPEPVSDLTPAPVVAQPQTASSTASEPAVAPATAKIGFDVESLFEDQLEPERTLASNSAEQKAAGSASAASQPAPASRLLKPNVWPLIAAAALLGFVAIGFSSRGCSSEDSVASRGDTTAPAPSVVAPAPAAAPEPAPPPAAAPAAEPVAAAPTEQEQAADEVLAAEQAQAVADEPSERASRTLTASQARPVPTSMRGGGVIQYRGSSEPEVDFKSRGRELFSTGKYRDAADAYERASQRSPSDAGAFAGLGASWLAAGNPDRAISAYQRALQLKPGVSGFQAALGRAYLQKGDRGRAAAAYRKALDLDPQNAAAKSGLQSVER